MRMKKAFRNLKLNQKFTLAVMVIVVVPMIAFSIFLYWNGVVPYSCLNASISLRSSENPLFRAISKIPLSEAISCILAF